MEITFEIAASLLDHAKTASTHAYVPYSHFPVGAAALTADGDIVTGANIENASYPLTCCAERVAIFRAVMAGHTEVQAIAVYAPRSRGCTPCGACRQVLNEWRAPAGMTVVLEGEDGPELVSLDDLLPRAFGPRNLDEASTTGG